MPSMSLSGWIADASERPWMCFGIGRCRITPSTLCVVVHRAQPRLALVLRQRARPRLVLERDADFLRRARLAAHVNGDFLVLADADRHEPAERVLGGARVHARGDAVENSIANGSAVQEAVIEHALGSG